jgi:hypothetical protein
MPMSRRLQITLHVIAAYLASFGILFVFAPSVFERVTETPLPDATLTLLYGQYTLTFAFVAFMAAREKNATSTVTRDSDSGGRECCCVRVLARDGQGRPSSSWARP